jgi:radical SAM superfamily enzyme YgiQ (UPF0313 family)
MKILFVYPRFERHAQAHPELLQYVPMDEYLGSPSLGMACLAAVTPAHWEIEFRDDRLVAADTPTDADLVALSFFTAAASRALELAAYFRQRGTRTVAGGLFTTAMPDVVLPHVDAVVVGVGDGAWKQLLADWEAGAMKPRHTRVPVPLASSRCPSCRCTSTARGATSTPTTTRCSSRAGAR